MNPLHISLIQADLAWEDTQANLDYFDQKIQALDPTDLIILPEMFSSGFSMNPQVVAQTMDGKAVEWMRKKATETEAVITGSLAIKEGDQYYNRLIWMFPNGSFKTYDKKHLFTMAKEQLSYTAGEEKLLIDYKGWKIFPLICYDLRFPIWNRNLQDYDLAIYVANWPAKRAPHWKALTLARAIENQAYLIAVNRVGTDGKGFYYSGDSRVIDPAGTILFEKADKEASFQISLSKTELMDIRKRLPFLQDRDII